jgi:hypothetical protein
MLGAEAVSYLSVTAYLREARFSEPKPEPDDSDNAILLALAEQPFASVRQLARLTNQPRSTVHRQLTQSLGFRVRHLR